MNGFVDGEVQSIDLGATVSIGVAVEVVSTFGVGRAVAVRPGESLAGRHRGGLMHRSVHGHGHGHHAVAAVGGRQDGVLCACPIERHSVPCVGQFGSTDGSGFGGSRNITLLNNEIVYKDICVVLILAAQDNVGVSTMAKRQLVGVPAWLFFSRYNRIAHFILARNEGQFGGSFNFAVIAGIYADTFILVV